MGAGLDCCVWRQKDDDQENATAVLENRCAPRHAPNETLEVTGILTPSASNSVSKIDNVGASPTSKKGINSEKETSISEVTNEASELEPMLSPTAQSFSVKNEASEEVERMPSLIAQSSSISEASEDLKPVQSLQSHDSAEELDIMPSPSHRPAPSVLYHSVSQWFNTPEDRFADGGKRAGNERSVHGRLQKSLTRWYSGSCTPQDLSQEHSADSEGEVGLEPETGAALVYSMSQSFKPTDLVSRPTLDKLGSFVMSQPAPALWMGHGTTSNVPHVG